MQSYPFRMTAENLAKYRLDPNVAFWKQLKNGSDNFEVTKQEVSVGVCNKQYVFNASGADGSTLDPSAPCPALKYNTAHADVLAKQKQDETRIAELVAQGAKPIRTVYADGGQHPQFAFRFPNVSRPDALAQGAMDVALDDSTAKKGSSRTPNQLASLKAPAVSAASAPDAKSMKPVTASAATPEPAKTQDSWFAGLGRWFGGSKETKPEAPPVAVATTDATAAAPTRVPVPPRRNETPANARQSMPAPGQAAAAPARPIQGTARVVPSGPATNVAQVQQPGR
jgi:hypothetical protein